MGAITMFILVIVISCVGCIYFTIQDRKEAKRTLAKKEAKKHKKRMRVPAIEYHE